MLPENGQTAIQGQFQYILKKTLPLWPQLKILKFITSGGRRAIKVDGSIIALFFSARKWAFILCLVHFLIRLNFTLAQM
jgi:hypothetical protein